MKLRVGVVGLGAMWESRYRPALRALSDRFVVRGVCEEVGHRAAQAAKEFRAAPVDGFSALARRGDIDAVLLLDRQWYGALPILAACDAGKAIYCAADLDTEPERAREIKDRVTRSGVAFMAEFPHRHAPATLRLKELIATRLGRPRLLFCHHRAPADSVGANGRRVQKSAQNALMELIDWCRYVVAAEPHYVTGTFHHHDGRDGEDDYQMMSLDFSGRDHPGTGAIAQVSYGRYIPNAWSEAIAFRRPEALQVCCESGIAFLELPTSLIWFDTAGRHMESLESERPIGELMLSQFHRSVTSLVHNTTGLEDAYRALNILQQAQTSHTQGRRIPL